MKSILVAYATTDGHARKVAEYVAAAFNRMGREVDLIDAASPAAASVTPIYAAAVIAGSVHMGSHQAALQDFVKRNVGWLNASPAAFLSVSLAAALDDEASRADCRECEQKFLHETGFVPGIVLPVAGALPYTQLDWFRRFAVKMVMKHHGGDTDTSQDFEYTDWEALSRFATEFVNATDPDAARQAPGNGDAR
jgi:menaquinone-dependent protoporphyrinogen oxidase